MDVTEVSRWELTFSNIEISTAVARCGKIVIAALFIL